jgi:hypothetical protein
MAALKRLKEVEQSQAVPWRFHYYGPESEHVREQAHRFGVQNETVLHGRVARAEALSAMAGSAVNVVITSVQEESASEDRGILTAKLFDSLGLGVPVLIVGPSKSDVETIIDNSGLGRVVAASDREGIVAFVREAISGNRPSAKNPEAYAWPNIIRTFETILLKAIEPRFSAGIHGGLYIR